MGGGDSCNTGNAIACDYWFVLLSDSRLAHEYKKFNYCPPLFNYLWSCLSNIFLNMNSTICSMRNSIYLYMVCVCVCARSMQEEGSGICYCYKTC